MLSVTHKIAFIRIQRTASQSMDRALRSLGGEFARSGSHWKACQYMDTFPELWKTCFTFAFVRNPWELWVSWWSRFHNSKDYYGSFREFILSRPWDTRFIYKYSHERCVDREGHVALDFIGHFERLQEDWQHVCDRIGQSLQLPYVNYSKHGPYQEFYDTETRAIIAELAAPDIKHFGYTFE